MLKLFNDFAKALFADRLKEAFPGYKVKKSLRGPLPGALNFECKLDGARLGWICFGGFKESDFTVFVAWTVSGMELKSLPGWEQYSNPNAFQVPPVPADGYVDLRDRWRFEGADGGPWHSLDMGSPSAELAQQVFDGYVASPQFEENVQRLYQGAQRLYTKNVKSLEQVRSEHLIVERMHCRSLWSHLAERYRFSDEELTKLLDPLAQKAVELVQQYGHPLILRQLEVQPE
jgi:hypothetical protein